MFVFSCMWCTGGVSPKKEEIENDEEEFDVPDSESTFSESGSSSPLSDLVFKLDDIAHIISCLYTLSAAMRQPAPQDRLRKYAEEEFSWRFPRFSNLLTPLTDDYLEQQMNSTNFELNKLRIQQTSNSTNLEPIWRSFVHRIYMLGELHGLDRVEVNILPLLW